jgi:hypothetical protein
MPDHGAPDRHTPAEIALHGVTLGPFLMSFITHEQIAQSLEGWQEGRVDLPDAAALAQVGAGSLVLALNLLRLILRAERGAQRAPCPFGWRSRPAGWRWCRAGPRIRATCTKGCSTGSSR